MIINKGQSIVQGSVREVKRQHGRNLVHLKLENDPEATWLDTLEGVQVTKRRQDYIEMHIQANLNQIPVISDGFEGSLGDWTGSADVVTSGAGQNPAEGSYFALLTAGPANGNRGLAVASSLSEP